MNYGFVVPVYNHGATLGKVINQLSSFNLPIIVIDDGNDKKNKELISEAVKNYSPNKITVVVHPKNGGKGLAIQDGIKKANEMGLSHIFQIDSDGQHDINRAEYFLEKSKQHPDAIICGYPEYDESAPKKRVNGRQFANSWIHFVTLSKEIKDAMIGFRVYPVKPCIELFNKRIILDKRMGFDIEILVRLFWQGVPVISESVKVFYPKDGISNFRYFRDTMRISGTYARLCIGMILRLPKLILLRKRKLQKGSAS